METNISNIISKITSLEFQNTLLALKILFIVLALFFLTIIIFTLLRTTWIRRLFFWDLAEFLTYRPHGVRKIVKQWARIRERLATGMESEAKLAVIEADSMLDDILKRMGYGGETLGERLKNLTAVTMPNIEEVWEAHKTRNNIVHDPDYRLSLDEARKAISIYEKALSDLQAL